MTVEIPKSKLKVALFGVGRLGSIRARILTNFAPRIELVAVCDPKPGSDKWVAQNLPAHVKFFADPEDCLVNSGAQAVLISTATATHAPLVLRALDLSLHVMVEKPIAVDIETTRAVVEKAKTKPHLKFLVPFCRRFDESYRSLKKLVDSGDLGEVHAVQTDCLNKQRRMKAWEGGVYRHSTAHDSSRDWVGMKVLVVGTSSSGFDTAYDCARRNIDVTLLQRSPAYVMSLTHSVPRAIGAYEPKNGVRPNLEDVDRLAFSMPVGPGEELGRRNAKTWRGQRGTGNGTLGQTRNGGFYFEAGACEQIINGKIKVEQGYIEQFTKDKVVLSGGREKEYDLVVFATGFSSTLDSVRATLGDTIADRCGPIWGIDEEGEFRSAYKDSGVPNLWMMVGYLPYTRYHSKKVALRLKALLEGVSPAPYTRS